MPNVAIIIFPGTNRELDMRRALSCLDIDTTFLSVSDTNDLSGYDAVILPGGFSFGDYLRPGAIAARMPIKDSLSHYAKRGGRILGVCNGFQILCETGLLPGALLTNNNARFICQSIPIRQCASHCLWTGHYSEEEVIHLPLAHQSGRYFATPEIVKKLQVEQRIVWKYGQSDSDEQGNPNGSVVNIAGITNKMGTILGIMPHPENAVVPSAALNLTNDGLRLFESILG